MIVSCKGLTKTYRTNSTAVHALRGIDLTIYQKEVVMITGPSGSGKTTLISVISGILNADEGECLIEGHDFNKMSDEAKTLYRGAHIGFIFQAFNLIPMFTAIENVSIPLVLNGTSQEEAERKASELLTAVGLGDKLQAHPPELSGGQQQRVAIARACVHQPDLIVCDEPTSSLDSQTGLKVMEILRSTVLSHNGTLIVVTHDPRIQQFADRIVKIEDGRVVE
ncbi:MAG: ABC transporter ATP-binding protein [Verrucomicrobia bacterium]|nr:ABC transporter ATP-binding protein [Verrucomicrobiota bacterium]